MPTQPSAELALFADFGREPSWTLDGGGLSATDRRQFKPQLAATALIGALAAEPAFWEQVGGVRVDPGEAWTVSRRYSRSRSRRELVALLLATAASGVDERCAKRSLYDLTVRAWFSPEDPPGRPSSYPFRDDFKQTVGIGASLLARRGAGRCFECGEATAAGDYCRADDRRVSVDTRRERERSIERLFYYARPGLAHRLGSNASTT